MNESHPRSRPAADDLPVGEPADGLGLVLERLDKLSAELAEVRRLAASANAHVGSLLTALTGRVDMTTVTDARLRDADGAALVLSYDKADGSVCAWWYTGKVTPTDVGPGGSGDTLRDALTDLFSQ